LKRKKKKSNKCDETSIKGDRTKKLCMISLRNVQDIIIIEVDLLSPLVLHIFIR